MMLSDLIAEIETGDNPRLFRFEPDTFPRWQAKIKTGDPILTAAREAHGGQGKCSWGTAAMICSTSWGAHQIMGFNLYGPVIRYSGTVIQFLTGGGQHAAFSALAKSFGIDGITVDDIVNDKVKRDLVARKWNGSGNVEHYSSLLLKAATT